MQVYQILINEIEQLKINKHRHLIHNNTWSDKAFKGIVVNSKVFT